MTCPECGARVEGYRGGMAVRGIVLIPCEHVVARMPAPHWGADPYRLACNA